jgi:hypothetical protein
MATCMAIQLSGFQKLQRTEPKLSKSPHFEFEILMDLFCFQTVDTIEKPHSQLSGFQMIFGIC